MLRLARKRNFASRLRQNNPTGKSLLISRNTCQAAESKINRLTPKANQFTNLSVSPDERGGSRSSRTRGGMRWTLELRLTTRGSSVRRSRVVLAPEAGAKLAEATLLLATVARELGSPGRSRISRKAIAQGKPDALRWTCMLVCAHVHFLHTRPRVQRAPGFPCALLFSGAKLIAKLRAHRAARWRTYAFPSLRGAQRRSNPASFLAMDCFANARNDELKLSAVIAREGGRYSIPETSVKEPRNRGILDHPPSRMMTPVNVASTTRHGRACPGHPRLV